MRSSATLIINSGTIAAEGYKGLSGKTTIKGGDVTAIATGTVAAALDSTLTNAIPGKGWNNADWSDDPEVIDVVITSNSWKVDPLTRRSVSGYVIKKDEYGKRAFGRSWCQDYMGGGKYGSLRNYGVGLGSFYLK